MARKKSEREQFMEIVFRASLPDCEEMIGTLKAKIASLKPRSQRKAKQEKPKGVPSGN